MLGGRTNAEYYRVKEANNALKSGHSTAQIYLSNDVAFRVLKDCVQYMRTVLYGKPTDEYARRIYNLLYNNYILLAAVFLHSTVPFKLNMELDTERKPLVAPEYEDELDFFILENE